VEDCSVTQASAPTIEPGQWVRHPDKPDWGAGQVQSVIGPRVTVNFENAGKILINAGHVALELIDRPG
jgi:Protein of unknown function (DUF3553)